MSLSPFGRRGGFYDAHSEVNRLLDEMFGGLSRRPAGRMAQATTEWAPSVDVLPKDGDLVVRAEMPGVKPEDVHVAVHNGVLTISGERKVDEEEERAGYYVRELRHGSFRRSMILPEGVDEEKIHARYQDGILEVTLEGAAAAREPRSIQIEVPPGGQQSATDIEVSESTQGARRCRETFHQKARRRLHRGSSQACSEPTHLTILTMWGRGCQTRQVVPVAQGPEGCAAWRAPALFCYTLLKPPLFTPSAWKGYSRNFAYRYSAKLGCRGFPAEVDIQHKPGPISGPNASWPPCYRRCAKPIALW